MIKITKDIKNEKLQDLFDEVDSVLNKRSEIQNRYLRGVTSTDMVTGTEVKVFFEKFITDLAAGYLSGEITYNTEIIDESEQEAYKILHPNSNSQPLDPQTAAQLKFIISSISAKNDDSHVLKQLFHDAVLFGCAYERELDLPVPADAGTTAGTVSATSATTVSGSSSSNSNPNYVYYPLSALNTVAVFPTDINDICQQKPVGLITRYILNARNSDDNQEHTLYYCIEANPYTNTYQTSIYDRTTAQEADSDQKNKIELQKEIPSEHRIPTFTAYEPDPQVSIIDPIISLIEAYENIMNNLNHLYQYNDTDAKLKISGYMPENPLTIPNPAFDPEKPVSASNPQTVSNPAREIEDNYLQNSKTFFVQEGGDVSWLLKEIHAEDATKYLKYYVDSIFQISGIPNTNDSAFNSGDLNASAIDRKFYTMALMLDDCRQGIKTLIKHRWEHFLDRINLIAPDSKHHFDINDVDITIGTNLPSMTDENINQQLALNGILSQKTLLSNLGYDYATEKKNKEEEGLITVNRVNSNNTTTAVSSADSNNNQVKNRIPNIQPREGRPNK